MKISEAILLLEDLQAAISAIPSQTKQVVSLGFIKRSRYAEDTFFLVKQNQIHRTLETMLTDLKKKDETAELSKDDTSNIIDQLSTIISQTRNYPLISDKLISVRADFIVHRECHLPFTETLTHARPHFS